MHSAAKTAEPIEMPLGYGLGWAQGSTCQIGVHIGATWRIRLNRPCAAAMRQFCQITLTTCYCGHCHLDLALTRQAWSAVFCNIKTCLFPACKCSNTRLALYYFAPDRGAKYCDERVCVCLSVCKCARVSNRPHVQTSWNFLYVCSSYRGSVLF